MNLVRIFEFIDTNFGEIDPFERLTYITQRNIYQDFG